MPTPSSVSSALPPSVAAGASRRGLRPAAVAPRWAPLHVRSHRFVWVVGILVSTVCLFTGNAVAAEIVVWDSYAGERIGIWKANADGSNAQPIKHPFSDPTKFPDCDAPDSSFGCNLLKPSLSPDGARVAFTTNSGDLYTSDLSGGALRQVIKSPKTTSTQSCSSTYPVCPTEVFFGAEWSPDGQTLVVERADRTGTLGVLVSSIYTVRADGTSPPQEIVNWGARQYNPAFSADGQRLVFTSWRDPLGSSLPARSVFTTTTAGGDPRQITSPSSPEHEHPAWGSEILFDETGIDGDILAMAADGTGLRRISASTGTWEKHPDYSSDGGQIVFTASAPGGGLNGQQLEVMNADGSGRHVIVSGLSVPGEIWKASMGTGTYVDPDPAENSALLGKYVPELRYDAGEVYRADSAENITDNYTTGRSGYSNYLKDATGRILAAANPKLKYADLSLGFLGSTYANGEMAVDVDRIDENDTYAADAQRLHNSGYANRAYGRVYRHPDGKVLQYWLWYYYNPKSYVGYGAHEGDWEMVQVHLDRTNAPVRATAAQHSAGEKCDWNLIQKNGAGRPVIYVAVGSHASYFSSGYHAGVDGSYNDRAGGDGERVTPTVEDISGSGPKWLAWPGRCGGSEKGLAGADSPRGPAKQGMKWENPIDWHYSVDFCTGDQSAG